MNKRVEARQGKPIVTQRAGVTVTRVGVNLGAEITGVDLRQPLSDEAFQVIEEALVENELIIFRNQDISSENLMDFGRRFGELTVHPFAPNEGKAPQLIKFRNDETNPPFGTDVWHSDETFRAEPPMATVLCAKEVPAVGGDTMFVSMSAAFDGLSDRMKQFISGLEAIHDLKPFRALFGDSEEDRKNLQHFELLYPPQRASGGARASGVGPQGAVRQSAVHHRHQGYGRAREPLAARHAVPPGADSRISVPPSLGAAHHRHVGQPLDPALRGQRLLSAATLHGARDHPRRAGDRASSAPIRRACARPRSWCPRTSTGTAATSRIARA